jgi:hypothetical protein
MLPVVSEELFYFIAHNFNTENDESHKLYSDMYKQQPVLELMTKLVIDSDMSHDTKDGFCKGMLQVWHLLNQQDILDNL